MFDDSEYRVLKLYAITMNYQKKSTALIGTNSHL